MSNFLDRNRAKLHTIRDYIVGWCIALTFWVIVRNVGVTVNAPATPEFMDNVRIIILFSVLGGVLFGNASYRLDKYLYRRIPLWRLTLVGIGIVVVIMMFLYVLVFQFFKNVVGFDQEVTFLQFISNPNAILMFFYAILVNIGIDLWRQVNLLLGKGNLLKFIKGDFYSPRVENRVFMFIDLKNSTTIAEELGHIRYSQFIQDCFFDLHVVEAYGAEVYQYVGDEVVLSWHVNANMDYSKCLHAFWAFEDKLRLREKDYMKKFGITPTFKAGLHLGEVTAAEVGEIKREIAYHGDTMNVAARIQEKCNEFESSLLVSEHFLSKVKINGYFTANLKGEELLRGKAKTVQIYALKRN